MHNQGKLIYFEYQLKPEEIMERVKIIGLNVYYFGSSLKIHNMCLVNSMRC